jgi:hypothetical protein
VLTVSDEIEAIIGYPAADFVDGSKLVAATHPDDRDPVMEQIDAAIDAGRHRAPCRRARQRRNPRSDRRLPTLTAYIAVNAGRTPELCGRPALTGGPGRFSMPAVQRGRRRRPRRGSPPSRARARASEALANVARYAGASHASVRLRRADGGVSPPDGGTRLRARVPL